MDCGGDQETEMLAEMTVQQEQELHSLLAQLVVRRAEHESTCWTCQSTVSGCELRGNLLRAGVEISKAVQGVKA